MDYRWTSSTFCSLGDCVEVQTLPDRATVLVRSSADGDAGHILTFSNEEWTTFIAGVKAGEFDLPLVSSKE